MLIYLCGSVMRTIARVFIRCFCQPPAAKNASMGESFLLNESKIFQVVGSLCVHLHFSSNFHALGRKTRETPRNSPTLDSICMWMCGNPPVHPEKDSGLSKASSGIYGKPKYLCCCFLICQNHIEPKFMKKRCKGLT